MSQGVVYVALFVLGVVCQLAVGPRDRPGLCGALGFLTGLAVWALGALVVIASPLRYDATTATLPFAIPLAIATVLARRRWRPSRRDLAILGAWTLGFTVAVVWLCSFDASRFSPDSRNLVVAGLRLAGTGHADFEAIATRGVFQILAHSLAAFTTDDYGWALASVTGLSIGPLFAALLWRSVHPAIALLAAAVVLTTYDVTFHLFYIHTNLGAAAYLLGALGLLWRAESEQDARYLPGALVFLGAFALHRAEGALHAAVVIVVAIYPSKLPRRTLATGLALYAIPCALWYLRVAATPHALLTANVARLLAAGTLALLVGLVAIPARLRAHAPRALAVAMAIALVVAALVHPREVEATLRAMHANLLDTPLAMWGHTWWVIPALVAFAWVAPPTPHGETLAYGALCTLGMILLLGAQHPYRVGVTDSGNRLMLQVLPLALLYVTARLAPTLRR